MKKITLLTVLFLLLGLSPIMAQGLVINEVLSSNTDVNTDEDGDYQDWVELYNGSAVDVNLNGFGLSDDPAVPFKWVFPNVTINVGEYLLIWCSDKNRTTPGQPLHTNWKISAGGEVITLTDPASITVDASPAASLNDNISWGRLPNGTGPFVMFQEVTPAAVNSTEGFEGFLEAPDFSQTGGFFTAGFDLTISTQEEGATIYYTLDGSDPDPANLGGTTYQYKNQYIEYPGETDGPMLTESFQTLTYSSPITIVDRSSEPNKIANISTTFDNVPAYIPTEPIFKGTVVRAKVFKEGSMPSPIASHTYFITPEGASRYTLPVVSIAINDDKFFDYEDGIQVAGIDYDTWRAENPTEEPHYMAVGNFYRRGSENEKIGNFTYIVDGNQVVSQDIGYRTRGGGSAEYPSKALNMYVRAELGGEFLEYPFFSTLNETNFDRLMLRNGGGDFYGTMYRDGMIQQLCAGLNVENEDYQPVVAFINGEYRGILDLREKKYDNNYFERVYGIDDVDVLEDNGDTVEEGDNDDYLTLRDYMENNSLVDDANYNYVLTRLDPESFADYFISNIYFDNTDWPGTNILFWRKKTEGFVPNAPYGHDGRWRWALHDMDDTLSFGSDGPDHDNLASATALGGPDWPNPEWSTLFLRRMLENNTFKNHFINRFADLMNSWYLSDRLVAKIDEMSALLAPEMAEHSARWDTMIDVEDDLLWYYNLYTDFANQRPGFQRDHIRNKFSIANNINATLDVSDAAHGFIHMNTIDVKDGTPGIVGNPYPWTGVYFSNIPVTLTAVPLDGYEFSHWTGASTSTDATITISSASAFSVTAHFIPVSVAVSEPIYNWFMGTAIPNDTPLLSLNTTFNEGPEAFISYQSCFLGYPFDNTHPNWRKGSMERRNSPTALNYIPEANGGAPYSASAMRGLQITQPFQNEGLENTMVFNINTDDYKDIIFAAAVKDEGAATGIAIDYSVAEGTPLWTTEGLTSSTFALTGEYQVMQFDFTSVVGVNNNPSFKIRLRFMGPDLTADNGDRVTFNNISVHGTVELGVAPITRTKLHVFPNPFNDMISVAGLNGVSTFDVYTLEGRKVKSGAVPASGEISLGELSNGLYLLTVNADGVSQTMKVVKK